MVNVLNATTDRQNSHLSDIVHSCPHLDCDMAFCKFHIKGLIKKYKGDNVGRKKLKHVIQFMLYSSFFPDFGQWCQWPCLLKRL